MTDYRNRIAGLEYVSTKELRANPANFRRHPQAQSDALRGVLEQVGIAGALLAYRDSEGRLTLIDGHLRKDSAPQTWPVLVLDVTDDEAALLLATHDPIAAMAQADAAALDSLLRNVSTDSAAVQSMLAELAEGAGLYPDKPAVQDVEPQIDRAEELRVKWGVQPGDLWQLGDHRLICGDCTDPATVARVMQGERAGMVFTDPPYNVASESRNYAADRSKSMQALANAAWDHDFDIKTLFPALESVMANDCAVYVCTSHWLVQTIWEWMWGWSDFCFYNVWCKPNPMPSLSKRHWTWATELIAYAVRGHHVANFPADGHALNWWAIPKQKETDHPTEKVLAVPARAIEFSSNAGDLVFDGFLGSGTTLIACEQLGRKCRAVEISPAYVAVALERWATATNKMPERIG